METMQKAVNYQKGASGVFAFGENATTGITSNYYVPCQFDEGLSATLGTIATNAKEKTRLFRQNGNKGCYIYTNETDDAKTLSVTYADDAMYWQNMAMKLVDKNLLTNLLTGERFKDGNDIITVVGTNGTKIIADNLGRRKVTTNNSPYNMFNYVGKMMIPQSDDGTGKPIFTANVDNDGNKINGKTVGLEAIYTFDDNTVWGVRFVFCMAKKSTFTEGQPNKIAIEFDVYCDTHIIDTPFTDGVSAPDTVATTGADAIYAFNADYLIKASAISAPTFAGTIGQITVGVDTDDGKVYVYKHDGTDWGSTPVTSTLGAGCQIYGAKVGTSLATVPTTKSGYVAIATAGVSGSAVAATTKTKSTGSGTEDYVFNNRYFDLGTLAFIDYTV